MNNRASCSTSEYEGYEDDIAHFVDSVNYHLNNLSDVQKNILDKAVYFSFEMFKEYAGRDGVFYNLCDYSLLDAHGEKLPVSIDEICGPEGQVYYDYTYETGIYIYQTCMDKIKLK